MNIKNIFTILITCTLALTFISCGDEENSTPSLNGTWSGGLIQPEFGTLNTTLTFSGITDTSGNGSGSFLTEESDLSNCNSDSFICERLSCSFNLNFVSLQNGVYNIDQILGADRSTCGDGFFEITVRNDNEISVLWYQEAFPDNQARGTLTRN